MADNMAKAPSSPRSSSQTRRRRFSSTSRFIHRVFCHLLPSSAPTSPSPTAHHTETSLPLQQNSDNEALTKDPTEAMAPFATPVAIPIRDNKENRPPPSNLADGVAHLSLNGNGSLQKQLILPGQEAAAEENGITVEKSVHQVFMDQALDMARLALRTNETPVGCVLVHDGVVIAKGMNATNITRNGTRHAEFMALTALLSYRPDATADVNKTQSKQMDSNRASADMASIESQDIGVSDNEYVKGGHLYPYGQKLHPSSRVDRSIVRGCVLYVTVEPCVMCAGLLRQLGIKKVYFGAVNDKFGGAGGVFSIHMNSAPTRHPSTTFSGSNRQPLHPSTNTISSLPRPIAAESHQARETSEVLRPQDGDGGNVEDGFEIEGGWGRDEAVGLLRRFYVQENGRAPVPRKKEGRAARLAAMEKDGNEAVPTSTAVDVVDTAEGTLPTEG